MKRICHADMKKYTSFRVGGWAEEMLVPENLDELRGALQEVRRKNRESIILGNGTNTLVLDGGFKGTVIKLGSFFGEIKVDGDKMDCGCGTLMPAAAKAASENGLTGFEFASGIPGSLGGAIFMNAGAYGGEMRDIVESVTVLSRDGLEMKTYAKEEMGFSYRRSILQETGEVAVFVRFGLARGKREEISRAMADLARIRGEKQPVQYPSAGSFFKRPKGFFAAKLIDDAGLKGLTVGGAQVSRLHSGFIINTGGATAEDIIRLMEIVRAVVMDKYGVELEPEVRIVGDKL